MSDHSAQSFNDTNERSRRSMQSVWMSHWTRTSYNVTAETRNHNASGNKELDRVTMQYHPKSGLEASGSVIRLGEIETTSLETMNDNLGTSSRNLRNEGFRCQYIPKASPFEYSESSSKVKDGQGADEALGPSLGSFAVTKPSLEYLVGSSSHIVPYEFDNRKYEFNKGKTPISSFIDKSAIDSYNQLANASLRTLEREHHNSHRKSAFLVYGRQIDSDSQSGNSRNARFSGSDAPSISYGHLSVFGRERFQKMQKLSGMKPFPTQSSASERTELKKSHTDCYSLEKLPNCVDDAETMRIYANVDSVEEEPGGCSRFSQITHSLLVTKKTDVNSSKENDFLQDGRVVTVFNGNKSRDFHNLTPYYGQGQQGVKLQPLVSSTDSEGNENVEDIKASKVIVKNESSTETDAMDVDSFKGKNQFSAANSTPSNKVIRTDSDLPLQINITSSEVGCYWSNMLPNRNLELPTLVPAAANSTENARPSSSRTQSLVMDVLVAHATHPSNMKSNPIPDGAQNIDPSNRWVKRLKLSTSNPPAHGTEFSDLGENLSHEKMSRFFRKIGKDGMTSANPTAGNCFGKELMVLDKNGDLSRKGHFTNVNPIKIDRDSLLSHTWIQRWLCNGSTIAQKKSKSVGICELQSSKLALVNLHEKKFPSVAAMALMGKAMTGFQPCELQNRGSFVVWNSRAF